MVSVSDYPERRGIIHGFSSGNPNFISDVMRDLQLRSPLDFWLWVSHCSRNMKMGEPTVDFIIMLDILRSARRTKLPEKIAEFRCDDEVQMKTYADLVSKLYDVYPNTSGPVETEKLFSAARDYLACCGIDAGDEPVFSSRKGDSARKAIEDGYRVCFERQVGDVSIALGEKIKKSGRSGGENNVICILRPMPDISGRAILDFLQNEIVSSAVLRASMIENSLIETLLGFSKGLEISAYGTEHMVYPLAEICTGFAGDYLVEIPRHELFTLQMIGTGYHITMSPVANVKKKAGIDFSFSQGVYRMNPTFLAEAVSSVSDVAVGDAEAAPLTSPSFSGSVCTSGDDGYYPSDEISAGCAYYDGSSAVVSAVSKAVALGNALDRIQLTNVITYGKNHASGNLPSKLVSHLLGLYRAQMELCLPDIGSSVETGDADKIYVVAKGAEARAQDSVRCGTVYLASPALSNEGFPDYSELRRLFKFVSGAVTTGRCRAEAIGIEGAEVALRKLCGGDSPISVDNVSFVPGAFLLLTEEKIEGLQVLGRLDGEPRSLVLD